MRRERGPPCRLTARSVFWAAASKCDQCMRSATSCFQAARADDCGPRRGERGDEESGRREKDGGRGRKARGRDRRGVRQPDALRPLDDRGQSESVLHATKHGVKRRQGRGSEGGQGHSRDAPLPEDRTGQELRLVSVASEAVVRARRSAEVVVPCVF